MKEIQFQGSPQSMLSITYCDLNLKSFANQSMNVSMKCIPT